MLERRDAALCWSDRRGRPVVPLWRTAPWGYVRLHEGTASPRPAYGRTALGSWLDRIDDAWPGARRADVFVYFNNDRGAAAVRNARTLSAWRTTGLPAWRRTRGLRSGGLTSVPPSTDRCACSRPDRWSSRGWG